jgi:hypothetical protein
MGAGRIREMVIIGKVVVVRAEEQELIRGSN